MSALPIDVLTMLGQMGNVGKIQHSQQVAASDLQRQEYNQDAKDLKLKDEQIEDVKKVEDSQVHDVTDKDQNQRNSASNEKKEHQPDAPRDPDEAPPDPSKGKIIDTVG